jgi:hypothetical protein
VERQSAGQRRRGHGWGGDGALVVAQRAARHHKSREGEGRKGKVAPHRDGVVAYWRSGTVGDSEWPSGSRRVGTHGLWCDRGARGGGFHLPRRRWVGQVRYTGRCVGSERTVAARPCSPTGSPPAPVPDTWIAAERRRTVAEIQAIASHEEAFDLRLIYSLKNSPQRKRGIYKRSPEWWKSGVALRQLETGTGLLLNRVLCSDGERRTYESRFLSKLRIITLEYNFVWGGRKGIVAVNLGGQGKKAKSILTLLNYSINS